MTDQTFMRQEVDQIPQVVAGFLDGSASVLDDAATGLRDLDPALVVTVARGSSDHASAYLKYAIELVLGIPVASVGPSIASIYGKDLRLDRAAAIARYVAGNSRSAIRLGMGFVHASRGLDPDRAAQLALSEREKAFTSADFEEGVAAFREKRKPVWPR